MPLMAQVTILPSGPLRCLPAMPSMTESAAVSDAASEQSANATANAAKGTDCTAPSNVNGAKTNDVFASSGKEMKIPWMP